MTEQSVLEPPPVRFRQHLTAISEHSPNRHYAPVEAQTRLSQGALHQFLISHLPRLAPLVRGHSWNARPREGP